MHFCSEKLIFPGKVVCFQCQSIPLFLFTRKKLATEFPLHTNIYIYRSARKILKSQLHIKICCSTSKCTFHHSQKKAVSICKNLLQIDIFGSTVLLCDLTALPCTYVVCIDIMWLPTFLFLVDFKTSVAWNQKVFLLGDGFLCSRVAILSFYFYTFLLTLSLVRFIHQSYFFRFNTLKFNVTQPYLQTLTSMFWKKAQHAFFGGLNQTDSVLFPLTAKTLQNNY